MNGNEGLSASDVALLTGNGNNGWGMDGGWGSMIWLFAIIALMGGWGNGGFGGNGYHPQYATQDFVQNGFNFNDLQDQNRDIMGAITNGTAQAVAASTQAKYDNINVMKDVQAAIIAQIGDVRTNQMQLLANQNDCCCSTKMLINEVGNNIMAELAQARYENAMNTASINANTTAQTQRIIDMMTGNTIQDLRDQVQGLQLASQLQNVVRYPNGWTYNAGNNPFCNNGCGGCCNM
jgi:hypothetical protein